MLKLIIVEDNDFERDALANYINWDILGVQLIDTAYNGLDGVEKTRAERPDIIISDVKMPVMGGIEMVKTINALYPKIKIIFMSGYEDVALLKEAIELGAFNYIIKPVNPDELINTVKKVASVIIDEKILNEENSSNIKQYKDSLPYLQSKFLEGLIFKQIDTSKVCELSNQANKLKLRISGNYELVLIDLDFEGNDIFDISCRTDTIMDELLNSCKGQNAIFLDIQHNKIVSILYCLDEKHTNADRMIGAIVERLNSIRDEFKCKYTIGVSTVAPNLTDLYMLFKESIYAAKKKIEIGYGQVIYYEEFDSRLSSFKEVNKYSIKELITKITDKVFGGEDYSSEIQNIMEIVSAMPDSKIENVKSVFISLFNFISKQMSKNGENFDKVVGNDIDVYNFIISAKIIPDILKYVNQALCTIASHYAKLKTKKDDYIVDEILNILNNEYDRPITLTYLSDRVYLSPNYLRILFKNKMNISIQDYLTNIRINKAKELLKQNAFKIHEVGQMVGYANSTYFNVIFRSYVNMTPGDYRSKFLSTETSMVENEVTKKE